MPAYLPGTHGRGMGDCPAPHITNRDGVVSMPSRRAEVLCWRMASRPASSDTGASQPPLRHALMRSYGPSSNALLDRIGDPVVPTTDMQETAE